MRFLQLHLHIMKDLKLLTICCRIDRKINDCLEKNITQINRTSDHDHSDILKVFYSRNFYSQQELRWWENQRNTGFKIKWTCENCSKNIIRKVHSHKNELFIQVANLLHEVVPKKVSFDEVWLTLKKIKKSDKIKMFLGDDNMNERGDLYTWDNEKMKTVRINVYEEMLRMLIDTFNGTNELKSTVFYSKGVSDETLKNAAKSFFFITASPKFWFVIFDMFSDWLDGLSTKRVLGYINIYKNKLKRLVC